MRDSNPQVRAHACVGCAWVGEVVVEIPVGAGVLVSVCEWINHNASHCCMPPAVTVT